MSTFPIIELGQKVNTPQGAGTVVSLALVGGSYHEGSHRELEPPQVIVRLASTGEEVQVCLCKLELKDKKAQTFLRSEFHRLWPPIPDPIKLSTDFKKVLNHKDIGTVSQLTKVLKEDNLNENEASSVVKACFTSLIISKPEKRSQFEKEEKEVLAALGKDYER